jgi:DNA replicative helicase MCM subunit Mcm2 (Cdc46/Mcm family)
MENLYTCIKNLTYEDQIIEEMGKHGINEEYTIRNIHKLSRDGRIYKVSDGGWKTVQ